jgi:hypothetical protein
MVSGRLTGQLRGSHVQLADTVGMALLAEFEAGATEGIGE